MLFRSASGPALSAGAANLFTVTAAVPSDARYGAAEVLRISGLQVNGGAITAAADDAVHKVAYLGDATGDRSYSAMDASNIARVVVGLDTGFALYPLADPTIVGDVTGDGSLSGMDTMNVARKAVLLSVLEIPDLPVDNVPVLPSGGIDPVVTVGTAKSAPGTIVTLPLSIDSAGGLKAADFTVSYNTALLDLANADVALGALPAGWSLVRNVIDSSGLARIGLYNSDPLASASGVLVNLNFHIVNNASSTTVPVSLVTNTGTASRLNEGQLPLTPVAGAVVINATRPRIKQVLFSTASQTAAVVRTAPRAASLPTYALSGYAPQTSTLPLTGSNQIQVVFDKDVFVTQNALALTGFNVARYPISSFSYDSVSRTATWKLGKPIQIDRLQLSLSNTVRDESGNPLDSKWATGMGGSVPTAGAAFVCRFSTQPLQVFVVSGGRATELTSTRKAPIDFGTLGLGKSGTVIAFQLTNSSGRSLPLGGVQLPKGFKLLTALPKSLAVSQSVTIKVQLLTTVAKAFTGSIHFLAGTPSQTVFEVPVTGVVLASKVQR